MKISLGAINYCWDKATVEQFYDKAAQSQVDTVYLGETVCSRRRIIKFQDYLTFAKTLKQSGKNVVLSTMALIEAQSELTELKKYIDNGDFIIEANDMAAVQLAKEAKLPFICGPTINNYNRASLDILHKMGMQRFVMPFELSKTWLETVIGEKKPGFEIEIMGHGYIPLAHSARCFTAKHFNLSKDNCETICQKHPKGILAQTQENQNLLRLNGIQTQSASFADLSSEITHMNDMGVDYFRVSPSHIDCVELANGLVNKISDPHHNSANENAEKADVNSCNGYWFGEAGLIKR
ncbi:U32 family peptidase [Shewanella donghaensis]|uniref:U32 family peptidase n=1 Tax=Shewanella donghaensis TaxID=238836 RepID=UPI001182565C|nr:U32 family peptidase [Shewanella donghaensis]